MAIKLTKGGRINLEKEAPGLKEVLVGLGWDANTTDTGGDFDLDVSVLMLDKNGKALGENYFIFYNNPVSPCGAVKHLGDNRTGTGEGDDEQIIVDLEKIDPKVGKMIFIVSIYKAEERKQNFGLVENAYIRLLNNKTGEEIARYDLGEDFSTEIAVNFGELYKKEGQWRFRAVGMGQKEGLGEFLKQYGFEIE